VIGYSYPSSSFQRWTLWKNGIATNFPNGTTLKSVCASGNDVYMAGSMNIGATYSAAVLWKNGVATYLTDGTNDNAQALAVSVVGNDVYVLGSEGTTSKHIKVWKNSTLIYDIEVPYEIWPTSMYVYGSDVYIAGYESGTYATKGVRVWKNGIETILTNPDKYKTLYANSIFVKNNNVYVVGYRTSSGANDGAVLWTNGIAEYTPNAYFYSVFVYGNDVYVAGETYIASTWYPAIWKNGEITLLSSRGGDANAVFVVPSSTSSIDKIFNANSLIYPNPTSNSFIVDYGSFIQVKIYDMLGNELLTQNANGKTEINISSFPKGVYYVNILSEGKVIGNSKIVKQ